MAGYLDQYGAGEERREKIIKNLVISLVALVVLGGIAFFVFHNYRQEHQVKRFFELLQAHDYQGAYALWVRTRERPARAIRFTAFMQDWGPQSGHRDVSNFRISKSRSCGSGDPDSGFRHQSAREALGAAGRSDDRVFAAARMSGAAVNGARAPAATIE